MSDSARCIAAFVFAAVFCAAALQAQGTCNMNTIAGTYAFQAKGSSSILFGPAPSIPLHWTGAVAPIATTGQLTIRPDGNVTGFYWGMAGMFNTGLAPEGRIGRIKELNPDCTGIVEGSTGTGNITERFVVLGNGKEIWAVTTDTSIPPASWSVIAYRISNNPNGVVNTCGPHTARGIYATQCEILHNVPGLTVAGSLIFRFDVGTTGDFTGSVVGKIGTQGLPSPLPVSGKLNVNPDCTLAATMNSPIFMGETILGRGVLFDGGREFFFQPLTTAGPGPGQTGTVPYGACRAVRVDR